jgi:hypothetical protein
VSTGFHSNEVVVTKAIAGPVMFSLFLTTILLSVGGADEGVCRPRKKAARLKVKAPMRKHGGFF